MNQQLGSRFMLAIFICISFAACKGKDEGGEKGTATDSTKATPTTETSTNPADMNAVKVAPDLYKVVADTLGIRLVEVNYKPGDSSAMHWHPDYAVYAIEGGVATFYAKDGSKMDNEMKAGTTMIRPAEWHSVKNNGKTNIHVMVVEVSRSGQMTSPDALDATKVASGLYKLLNDTLGIRIIGINYKPGQSSVMHSHPDLALYVTDPGTAEFTAKDGTKRTMDLTKGMSIIIPADTHSAKNTGKTTIKGILVEVHRAMK
jgi:quercetin dioxygenase-like cupin family protein